jgi:hypothetical protein
VCVCVLGEGAVRALLYLRKSEEKGQARQTRPARQARQARQAKPALGDAVAPNCRRSVTGTPGRSKLSANGACLRGVRFLTTSYLFLLLQSPAHKLLTEMVLLIQLCALMMRNYCKDRHLFPHSQIFRSLQQCDMALLMLLASINSL